MSTPRRPPDSSIATKPNTLPSSDASPLAGALKSTSPTPPKATRAKTSARRSLNSPNSLAPIGTMRNGASEPISAALATLLFVAPAKKMARFRPKNAPGRSAWRTCRIVTRRPVLQRYRLNTTVATVSLQNAMSTPGVSARLASVELSENPMTTPATASAPRVFRPDASGLR